MHIAKLVLYVILTIAVMRGVSWLFGWLLNVLLHSRVWASALSANFAGLAAFVVFLRFNQMPDEPFDLDALIFGFVIFGVCFAVDLKWSPWKRPLRSRT